MDEMFSFGGGAADAPNLIPAGTLSFALIEFGAAKTSGKGATYYPVTLTLMDGQHEGRKVFDTLPDLKDPNVSPGWKKMAQGRLIRILETVGIFNPANKESYKAFNNAPFVEVLKAVSDRRVAIRVSVEKSEDPAYADKNKVGEFLSPNPESAGYRDFVKLQGGQGAVKAARQEAFGSAPAPASAAGVAPNWIKTPTAPAPTQTNDNPF